MFAIFIGSRVLINFIRIDQLYREHVPGDQSVGDVTQKSR